MKQKLSYFTGIAIAVLLTIIFVSPSFAANSNTEAGRDVTNTATVDYTISGIAAPTKSSNTATFRVDEMIDVAVAKVSDATVVGGTYNSVLEFTITNESNNYNSTGYFEIEVFANGGTFNMNSVRVYADDGGTPGSWDATDSAVGTLGSPAVVVMNSASVASAVTYFVVADTPGAVTASGETAIYDLEATAWAGSAIADGALTFDGVDVQTTMETVAADAAGSYGGDTAGSGKHSATATYTSVASLAVTKAATTGGFYIPGSTVTYTIDVTNADTGNDATGVTIADAIPTYTTFTTGTLACTKTDGTSVSTAGTAEVFDNTSAWVAPPGTAPITQVRCDNGTVGQTTGINTMTFDVTID